MIRGHRSARRIWLREWQSTEVELSLAELAALRSVPALLTIEPLAQIGRFRVTPKQIVGTAWTRELEVVIEPKLEIRRLFYLLGFADRSPFLDEIVAIDAERGIGEAMVGAYTAALWAALRRGLPSGYRHCEEASFALRGRLRYQDQISKHFGRTLPLEIEYDDFTVDTPLNRVLRAALVRCDRYPALAPGLRTRVRASLSQFELVGPISGPLPEPPPVDRANDRFRPALQLARLILTRQSAELRNGSTAVPSFLIDMDKLFEQFVFNAIARRLYRLGLRRGTWRRGEVLPLDTLERLRSRPDLTVWDRAVCAFVGDAKHKRTSIGELSDIYQMTTYCTAAGLPGGLLIYANGPDDDVVHQILAGGPKVTVAGLPLAAPLLELEGRLDQLAQRIRTAADRDITSAQSA